LHALDHTLVSMCRTEFQGRVLERAPSDTHISYAPISSWPSVFIARCSTVVRHANALTLVSIITPCHSVIGASATLAVYAGCSAPKEFPLRYEKFQGMLINTSYTG
jgi:O6-methylguanine-DNA--protein-cysteine methyltransferase